MIHLEIIALKFLLWAGFFFLICFVTGPFSKRDGSGFLAKGINTLSFIALLVCLCGFIWNLAAVCWNVMIS